MDFTREPIIETVITPKDGWTLVVRSSKNAGQEEYFVDAVEVITFGGAVFFRSRERPKSFMVPVSDYEVLEVRETRLVLKNVGIDRSIKIGGGREASKNNKESSAEKADKQPQPASPLSVPQIPSLNEAEAVLDAESSQEGAVDAKETRLDKRRERKRNYRRKRSRDGVAFREEESSGEDATKNEEEGAEAGLQPVTSVISSLLPPPPTLISETISRYKDNALFKGAFFLKDEHQNVEAVDDSCEEKEPETLDSPQDKVFDDLLDVVEIPQMSLDFPVYEGLATKENTMIHVAELAEEAAGVAEAFVKAAEEAESLDSQDVIQEVKEEVFVKSIEHDELLEHFQKRIDDSITVDFENAFLDQELQAPESPTIESIESFTEQASENLENTEVSNQGSIVDFPAEKIVDRRQEDNHEAEENEGYDKENIPEHSNAEETIPSLQTQEQLEWSFDGDLESKEGKKPEDTQ